MPKRRITPREWNTPGTLAGTGAYEEQESRAGIPDYYIGILQGVLQPEAQILLFRDPGRKVPFRTARTSNHSNLSQVYRTTQGY